MSVVVAWLCVLTGQVFAFRAARLATGSVAGAALASGTMLVGQLITFPLGAAEAAMFAAAAIAVERAFALHAAGRPAALALLLLPAAAPLAYGAGLPTPAHFTDAFFCSQHGVAATSAVLWLGFAGAMLDRRSAIALAAFAATAAGAFDVSWSWEQSTRLFAAAIPTAVVGLAQATASLRGLAARRPGWAMVVLLAPLLLFNLTLLVLAQAGGFRLGEPIAFGPVGAAQARVQHDWFGHPFSFPATLYFTVTTGLPPAHFDLQGVSHLDAAHPLRLDIGDLQQDAAWIGEGWHGDERAGDGNFRWAKQQAEIFVPPLPAARVTIRVRVRAIPVATMPSQTLTLRLGSRNLGSTVLTDDWMWVERELDLTSSGARASRLTLDFGHAVRPANIDTNSGDTRDLAAAIDRVEILPR